MRSAGIEIIEKKEVAPIKEEKHSILAQKLSGSVQNPTVKTEHTLDNITKTNTPTMADVKPKIPGIDPYREIPE